MWCTLIVIDNQNKTQSTYNYYTIDNHTSFLAFINHFKSAKKIIDARKDRMDKVHDAIISASRILRQFESHVSMYNNYHTKYNDIA